MPNQQDKLDEIILKHLQNTSLDFFKWCEENQIRYNRKTELYFRQNPDPSYWPFNFIEVSGELVFDRFMVETFIRTKKSENVKPE